jgi:hypothetical protein
MSLPGFRQYWIPCQSFRLNRRRSPRIEPTDDGRPNAPFVVGSPTITVRSDQMSPRQVMARLNRLTPLGRMRVGYTGLQGWWRMRTARFVAAASLGNAARRLSQWRRAEPGPQRKSRFCQASHRGPCRVHGRRGLSRMGGMEPRFSIKTLAHSAKCAIKLDVDIGGYFHRGKRSVSHFPRSWPRPSGK